MSTTTRRQPTWRLAAAAAMLLLLMAPAAAQQHQTNEYQEQPAAVAVDASGVIQPPEASAARPTGETAAEPAKRAHGALRQQAHHRKAQQAPASTTSYAGATAWRRQMAFLPPALHWAEPDNPASVGLHEATWEWGGHAVHLDRFDVPDSPVQLILLHGVGTNARQMSLLVGAPLRRLHKLASLAVDMPLYGQTKVNPGVTVTYDDWVALGADLVKAEAAKHPGRPIVLYGLSAGGMLAYHIVARVPGLVKGIVGMSILDQRVQAVRDGTSANLFMSRVGVPLAVATADSPLGAVSIPVAAAAKMSALVNNEQALEAFLSDYSSAGNWVPTRFLAKYMTHAPAIEPEAFDACPILLTQPAQDRWTPLELSEYFLKRIQKVSVKKVMLENAGHFPLEQPGIDQLHAAMAEFVGEVAGTASKN